MHIKKGDCKIILDNKDPSHPESNQNNLLVRLVLDYVDTEIKLYRAPCLPTVSNTFQGSGERKRDRGRLSESQRVSQRERNRDKNRKAEIERDRD